MLNEKLKNTKKKNFSIGLAPKIAWVSLKARMNFWADPILFKLVVKAEEFYALNIFLLFSNYRLTNSTRFLRAIIIIKKHLLILVQKKQKQCSLFLSLH